MGTPITATAQIAFCDSTIRVGANMLGEAYTSCLARNDRWLGLGSGTAALAQMTDEIRKTADFLVQLYDQCFQGEKRWFLLGGTSFIPNDATVAIWDGNGQPDPSRPAMNGANVVNLISQQIAFRQWLQNGAFATGGAAGNFASYNTVMQVSSQGPTPIAFSDGANFITRCTELLTQYQTTSNAVLNVVLACAPNPGLDANR
jgi:hypothetical protein